MAIKRGSKQTRWKKYVKITNFCQGRSYGWARLWQRRPTPSKRCFPLPNPHQKHRQTKHLGGTIEPCLESARRWGTVQPPAQMKARTWIYQQAVADRSDASEHDRDRNRIRSSKDKQVPTTFPSRRCRACIHRVCDDCRHHPSIPPSLQGCDQEERVLHH